MSSKDTQNAQKMMKDAAAGAREDEKFLKEYSDKEKKTRETGEKEMKNQTGHISKLKVRG